MNRILFVDDDPALHRAFQRLFPVPQYEVESALDGASALPLLELRDFDVIVVDYQMPYMNGAELLALAKGRRPQTVRVLMTARCDMQSAVDAVNRGEVFRILKKPWDDAEVRFSIRLALELRQMGRDRDSLEQALAEKNVALQRAHGRLMQLHGDLEGIIHDRTRNLLDALSAALDVRDNETEQHSRRVSLYAARLAEELAVDAAAVRVVEQGALLHDVGKIGVPDGILLKPGPLTDDEWKVMKRHPGIGGDLLRSVNFLDGARGIIVQHQERFDGTGYPLGLRGREICLGARIFAVVDTYDAITSDRPYRKGRPYAFARGEIERCAGTQLDPEVVAAFARIDPTVWDSIRRQVDELSAAREAA